MIQSFYYLLRIIANNRLCKTLTGLTSEKFQELVEKVSPLWSKANKKLLIIFGPPAVGKTTVGKILETKSDFKLFHIELLL